MANMPETIIGDAVREAVRSSYDDGYADGHKNGFEAGRQTFQPKWISVEERLPEESGSYLVRTRRSDAFTAHFYLNANEWKSHFAGSAGKHITHWMPLPTPPEEDV